MGMRSAQLSKGWDPSPLGTGELPHAGSASLGVELIQGLLSKVTVQLLAPVQCFNHSQ